MTELKTLKDLIYEGEGDEFTATFIKELKEEAIKWVKQFLITHNWGEANQFKMFFNITEDDLK